MTVKILLCFVLKETLWRRLKSEAWVGAREKEGEELHRYLSALVSELAADFQLEFPPETKLQSHQWV